MATKTVQLSTRITDGDAEFLAALQVEGAQTPSDKIRALIGEARRRREGRRDYRSALLRVEELTAPIQRELRAAENETGTHSELVRLGADFLSEALAFLVSQPIGEAGGDSPPLGRRLEALERGLGDRIFALVQAVLRLGVTEDAPCYNKKAVVDRLGPVLVLVDAIRAAQGATPRPAAAGEEEGQTR